MLAGIETEPQSEWGGHSQMPLCVWSSVEGVPPPERLSSGSSRLHAFVSGFASRAWRLKPCPRPGAPWPRRLRGRQGLAQLGSHSKAVCRNYPGSTAATHWGALPGASRWVRKDRWEIFVI